MCTRLFALHRFCRSMMSCARAYEYHILNTVPSTMTRGESSTASPVRSLDKQRRRLGDEVLPVAADEARPISATLPLPSIWLAEKNMM